MTRADLDTILLQLGDFGRFQFANYVAISFPILFSAIYTLTYVFTAKDLEYRCRVPECEGAAGPLGDKGLVQYLPDWLVHAVPHDGGGQPSACHRYAPHTWNGSSVAGGCSADLFNKEVVRCQDWVFEPGQMNSIASEWNITCDENKWQLSIVGTVNNIGLFAGLPFAGFWSDRYGRKSLLFYSWAVTCCMGIIRSFSTNLGMMLTFEFLDAFFGAGVFSAGFILALEFVGPDKRVMAGTVLNLFYSAGQVVLGAVAWAVFDWRWMLRSIYVPGFLCLLLLWPTPESVRWLASKGRYAEADSIIRKVAKFNRITINEALEDRVDLVQVKGEDTVKQTDAEKGLLGKSRKISREEKSKGCLAEGSTISNLLATFKSSRLLVRFINCSYCWMANTFVYYGLSLNSVSMAGNDYLNFILVTLIELPALLAQLWLMGVFGRRACLSSTMIIAGACCISFLAIPEGYLYTRLTMFMIGKFAITISFAVVYVYTAELFPTNVRHSLLGYCSMFGRIGSMLAPQTPLLATINESLPLTLFAVSSIVGGFFSLFFPETKDKSLPDSIKEAEEIGNASH
ncbi:solute carrier family 22 member 4 [Frankliniella occidentalis]|uniref:Solute carrier family 22 member 4 n=1 Tax=Frankliniella occidentalis TaxID=133901 RepID=A0A6J1T8D4_FRAOC|nr:solute carrier family 22 member 4 [Frankliniella occidentalis]XP_026289555.1 solute carrier family 22 member 4 [Frankliniella occidentalis]XP_026289556.1 solute carrier family 22 member 4 [Frankliniella occidentalis]